MFSRLLTAGIAALLLNSAAHAETFEIQMLNAGDNGAMVFQPDFVHAAPGDTINFISVDRGHNVETIEGMLPAGAEPMLSPMNENYTVTLTAEGVYGIKCTPHFGMGMVALIQVGAATNLEEARAVPQRGKAEDRFEAAFAQVQ